MKSILFCIALIVAPPAWASGDIVDPDLDREIRLMIELTDADGFGIAMIDTMIESFQKLLPDIPDDFWKAFKAEIDCNDLTNILVAIYAKHSTLEEIQAANRYYASPEGHSLMKKLPLVLEEAKTAGQEWGRALANTAMDKLKEQKLIPPDA